MGVSSFSVIDGRFSVKILDFSMLIVSEGVPGLLPISDWFLEDPDDVLFFL